MNEEDTSLYGKNREGKVALCETCAYDGYCRDKIRYYRCRNYIKIKDDYDKDERMLLMTALMMAAAQSNDPFRTPRRNTGVRRNDNQRKPKPVVRELREFTVKGHTIMAYSRKDAITRLKEIIGKKRLRLNSKESRLSRMNDTSVVSIKSPV